MSEAVILGIITAIGSVVGMIYTQRTSRRTAETPTYKDMASRLGEVEEVQGKLLPLAAQLRGRDQIWEMWYGDLAARWPYHRAQDTPPMRPMAPLPPPADEGL